MKVKIVSCHEEVIAAEEELMVLMGTKKPHTDRLKKTKGFLSDMKKAMKGFCSVKKALESLESKLMKVLKSIGVQLSTYHGYSLNGKYAKKVMDNAFFVFGDFAKILTAQCRNDSVTPQKIDKRYEECKSAFLLCDGAFSTAHKIDPTAQGRAMY